MNTVANLTRCSATVLPVKRPAHWDRPSWGKQSHIKVDLAPN